MRGCPDFKEPEWIKPGWWGRDRIVAPPPSAQAREQVVPFSEKLLGDEYDPFSVPW
jgi:hypothetical protein